MTHIFFPSTDEQCKIRGSNDYINYTFFFISKNKIVSEKKKFVVVAAGMNCDNLKLKSDSVATFLNTIYHTSIEKNTFSYSYSYSFAVDYRCGRTNVKSCGIE